LNFSRPTFCPPFGRLRTPLRNRRPTSTRLASAAGGSRAPQELETSLPSLAPGQAGWRSFVWALFLAGFVTFDLVFAPQAFLPTLSSQLDLDADTAAISVSATTFGVAAGVLMWASISDRIGRMRAIRLSLILAFAAAVAVPFLPTIETLLAVRFVEGLLLGAAPAVGMAYIAERIDGRWAAQAAGTFVAGNTIGGIVGRIGSGLVADIGGWRLAFGASTVIAAASIVAFLVLTRQIHDRRPQGSAVSAFTGIRANLRDPYMISLYLQGFLLMGAFGVIYNYFGYRLQAPPFALSASIVTALFGVYLAGTVSSRYSGALARRIGTAGALVAGSSAMLVSLPVMAVESVPVMVCGLVLFTVGCFTAHPLASGLSGRSARSGRAQSTALYQIAWLGGTGVFGWLGGIVYASAGWSATLAWVALLCVLAATSAGLGAAIARARRS
jgi:YNFM family putative membrane transporter